MNKAITQFHKERRVAEFILVPFEQVRSIKKGDIFEFNLFSSEERVRLKAKHNYDGTVNPFDLDWLWDIEIEAIQRV